MKWILGISLLGLVACASPDPSWMYARGDATETMRRQDFIACHSQNNSLALLGTAKDVAADRCMTKLGYTQTMWSR